MDWSEGYYAGLDYTFGYYHEMGPDHLRFACLTAGVQCGIPSAPTYLELGFGQGVSINLHAAGSEGDFHGVDFNPAHVLHAEGLGEGQGARIGQGYGLQLTERAFPLAKQHAQLGEVDPQAGVRG